MSWLRSAAKAPLRLWSVTFRPVKPDDEPPPRPQFDPWQWRLRHPEGTRRELAFARLSFWRGFTGRYLRQHWLGAIVLSLVLVVVGYIHARGMFGWPGLINYDEGVYMQQAWAVAYHHRMVPGPGSYRYDHPYGGWWEIAGFIWPTGALFHSATAVAAGRQFMLIVHLVSSVFIYLLARRLKMKEVFAGAAVLLFSLSPLALQYQRLVFLDNMALMWLIIAFWCLMSPGRGATSAKWAGLCLGLSFLCKETFFVPGVVPLFLALLDYRDRDTWFPRLWGFVSHATFSILVFYGVYALAKHELFAGSGHVSLVGTVKYQLLSRAGTGSILNPGSGTYHAAMSWLHQDPWLLGIGSVLAVLLLLTKRLRAVALCLVIQIVAMCRNGYLPFAYATALFPFAALAIAATADRLWAGVQAVCRRIKWRWRIPPRFGVRFALRSTFLAACLLGVALLFQSWGPGLETAMNTRPNIASELAAKYFDQHVPHEAKIVTNDDSYTDLAMRGFHPFSEFSPDTDPAVKAELPDGWRSIQYLLLGPNDSVAYMRSLGLTMVVDARIHARAIAKFQGGDLILWKVVTKGKPRLASASTPNG